MSRLPNVEDLTATKGIYMRRMNAPIIKIVPNYSVEVAETWTGSAVTVWYSIAGVAEVRAGISRGVEIAYGTSVTAGKFRKPENDVLVLEDKYRKVNPTPNRVEKVGPWSGVGEVPPGHCQIKDELGQRWLYRKIYDKEGEAPVEYRIPLSRITKIETAEGQGNQEGQGNEQA